MIGLLALQGDFERHEARLRELGAKTTRVSSPIHLKSIRGIVIPGGESSVLLKLSQGELREQLKSRISDGLPVLATCAGAIFLAAKVENPYQESLGAIDIDVRRNAYGRQVDSFIDPSLVWTDEGKKALETLEVSKRESGATIEGVFIRAPRITRVGTKARVLMEREGEPIMVEQDSVLAATFHPELSPKAKVVHELFLSRCR